MPTKKLEVERRDRSGRMEVRRDGGRAWIDGVIRYGVLSEDLGGFQEKLAPSVFRRTLGGGADVKMLWNHNDSEILGSSKAGTLVLENRDDGLHFSCLVPTHAMNRFETVERGDLDGVSFGFKPEESVWDYEARPVPVRTVTAARLLEISPCTFPAYPENSASATTRSRPDHERERLALELALYGA